tara:strand:+ start:750 stop:1049 length:300 start_codon:yes stop_codon:yes gene_type:complete
MGKKRRLNSAKAKFKAKHANHPRMQLLTTTNTNEVVEEVIESVPEAEVTVAPVEVFVAPVPVLLEEEETIVVPEIIAKAKRPRKRKTKSTKRTRKSTSA